MAARKAVAQELSKAKILDTARELFVSEGYQHVTMRKIAGELGYSHGALYYHFKNKAELFNQLVEQDFGLLDQWLDERVREIESPDKQIRGILQGYIQFGLNHPNHYQVMFMVQDDGGKSHLAEQPNHTYQNFAKAIHDLYGHKVTPMLIWSLFLSLHGFVTHYCKRPEVSFKDVKKLAESHVNFLVKGLQ